MKNINKDTILLLIKKYKEIIMYLIFGVLTTLVNFIVYIIATRVLKVNETLSNAIAWFISVLFAYITNKIWVFESKSNKAKVVLYEIISFFGCRALSGAIDVGLFFILVKVVCINDLISKCIIAVLIIILNYVFSKLIIFRKKNKSEEE